MSSLNGVASDQVVSILASGTESISVPRGTNVIVGHHAGSRIAMPMESTKMMRDPARESFRHAPVPNASTRTRIRLNRASFSVSLEKLDRALVLRCRGEGLEDTQGHGEAFTTASVPTTVVHSLTHHLFTRPLAT